MNDDKHEQALNYILIAVIMFFIGVGVTKAGFLG